MTRFLFIAVLVGTVAVTPATAGCPHIDREMDRTWDALMRSKEKLERCSVPHARGLMEQALRSLKDAQKESRAGRCRRSELQIEAAKGLLDRASRLCADTDRQQDKVMQFLNETDRLIGSTFDRSRNMPQDCRRLLKACREQQKNAWRQFRENKPRFALSISGGARRALDAARRCLRKSGGRDVARVPHLLERTDRLLERVHDLGVAPSGEKLKKAMDLQQRAWRSLKEGRPRQSVQFSRQARRMAMRFVSRFDGVVGKKQIAGLLRSAEEFLEASKHRLSTEPDRRVGDLLRRAESLLREGKAGLAGGDAGAAMAKVRAGFALALKASEMQESGGPNH